MSCKGTPVADQVVNAGNEASKWLADYTKANLNMAQSAVTAFSPVLSAWSQWYQSLLPSQLSDLYKSYSSTVLPSAQSASCYVPTIGCPPKCGCTITWDASRGEQRISSFKIQNTSKEAISYTIVPQPFKKCDKTLKAVPELSTQQVSIPAGESATVTAKVSVNEEFESGGTYEAEILVRGKYERCVKVLLNIACGCDDLCKLEVGDIPQSTSFDSWYKHFLCSEPCFPPIQQTQPPRAAGTVDTQLNAAEQAKTANQPNQ